MKKVPTAFITGCLPFVNGGCGMHNNRQSGSWSVTSPITWPQVLEKLDRNTYREVLSLQKNPVKPGSESGKLLSSELTTQFFSASNMLWSGRYHHSHPSTWCRNLLRLLHVCILCTYGEWGSSPCWTVLWGAYLVMGWHTREAGVTNYNNIDKKDRSTQQAAFYNEDMTVTFHSFTVSKHSSNISRKGIKRNAFWNLEEIIENFINYIQPIIHSYDDSITQYLSMWQVHDSEGNHAGSE